MYYLRFLIIYLSFTKIIFANNPAYWQQAVDYKMKVVLIDSSRQIACTSKIIYTNNSPDTLDRIYMHLYPNAFQVGSVKDRDYRNGFGRSSRAKYFKDGLNGYASKIDIRDFNISKKESIVLLDYLIDDTILRANLKDPLYPGNEVLIDIQWNHHIGGMVERAGYISGQYNMAQWYPKIAVYDNNGWHAGPFHAEGEFYGEFGNFDVSFEIPKEFIIGASGVVLKGDPGWSDVKVDTTVDFDEWLKSFESSFAQPEKNNVRKVTFRAENVHDFAWVASPNFLYEHDNWNNIDVHVLYNRSNGSDWNNVVRRRSIRALKWLTSKFGEYPYPQVTNVDRIKSGGMEYPMLVMDGSDSESLILHEIGHIWFYGILGNNELDEAWLDEGFTTSQTRDYMVDRYGSIGFDIDSDDWVSSFQRKFWKYTDKLHRDQWYSIGFITSGYDEPISRKSYNFKNGSAYYQNAYAKPALMLNELKYILGDSLYYRSIQNYFSEWKFKHVSENRFINSVEKTTGEKLDWFFDAWLHDARIMDYEIDYWKKKKAIDGSYDIELKINNLGQREMPLLIETELLNGDKNTRWWKNHISQVSDIIYYNVPSKPIRITLDPKSQTVDADFRNNSTKIKTRTVFNWPSMNYNPRDSFVLKWLPLLRYNVADDYLPGIEFERSYGPWELKKISINYAVKQDSSDNKNNIYWSYSGMYKPIHYLKNFSLKYWAFDQPGLKEFGFEINKNWSRTYRKPPLHNFKLGFYYNFDVDTMRTSLYEIGNQALTYLKYNLNINQFNFETDISSSVAPFSDWNFVRFTNIISHKMSRSISKNHFINSLFGFSSIGFRSRLIAGKIWSDKFGVSNQEGFNIEGNSSSSMFNKSYLRDESSFFGISSFNQHYHMPGEGNVRGFVSRGEMGSDALVASSIESYLTNRALPDLFFVHNLSFEFAIFADIGAFYNNSITRQLISTGFGFRFNFKILEKPLYLRIDIPYISLKDNKKVDYNDNWLISFQKSI